MESNLGRLSKNGVPEFGSGQPNSDRYRQIFHFFGLRENPFNINPDPRYLLITRQTQEALDSITYGIQSRQGLLLLTGEVGTGKTTLSNYLLNWLRERETPTSFIFNSRLKVGDLFDFVLADFGIICKSDQKDTKHALLTDWLLTRARAGETPILIVDEAQGLPLPTLEEIRLLLNLETSKEKLLQILLVGQPELEEKLARPELLQLRQRVRVRCKTGPLNAAETTGYIHWRLHVAGAQNELVFTSDALNAVHFYSCGIPRVINILCEHALINSYADNVREVSPQIVEEVARAFQFDKIAPRDARLAVNTTRRTGTVTTRSIPTVARVDSVQVASSTSPEQHNTSMSLPPVRAVDKNPEAPTALVANNVKIASTSKVVSDRRRWMPSPLFSLSSYPWRRWRDKSISILIVPMLHRAGASVVHWLQQPILPVHAHRRNERVLTPGHLPGKIIFARLPVDVWKALARFWHNAKARL